MARQILCICVALVSILFTSAVETGRWRYGSISWSRPTATSNRVTISIESAWRLSHESIKVSGTQSPVTEAGQVFKVLASDGQDPLFAFGDDNITARYDVEVVRIDPSQDLVVGKSEFVWDYSGVGPFEATLTLCCRVAENQNANGGVKINTTVDLRDGILGSPVIKMIPRIHLDSSSGSLTSFLVPAVPQPGMSGSLQWSLFNGFWGPPPLLGPAPNETIISGIDMSTGVLTLNVQYHRNGWKEDLQMLVQVEQGRSKSMVDFIVHVQRSVMGNAPTLTLIAPPAPHPLAEQTSSAVLGMPIVDAFVGFEVAFKVAGEDVDVADRVFFEYSTFPAGLTLEERFEENPATQRAVWVPAEEQVGEHSICAAAVDIDPSAACASCTPDAGETSCIPSCPQQARSAPLCFHLRVFANDPPVFASPGPTDLHYRIEMNQLLEVVVEATDANWVDKVSLRASNAHPAGSKVVRTPGVLNKVTFSFRPQPFHGGLDQHVCFEAADSGIGGGVVQTTELCMRVEVYTCRWMVEPGDTLSSVAAKFGSNYVQMWALNPEMESPDDSLAPGDSLNVGHMYRVRSSDNLRYLSVQFATTRGTLEMLNFGAIGEVGDKEALAHLEGALLCVLPHSCALNDATVV